MPRSVKRTPTSTPSSMRILLVQRCLQAVRSAHQIRCSALIDPLRLSGLRFLRALVFVKISPGEIFDARSAPVGRDTGMYLVQEQGYAPQTSTQMPPNPLSLATAANAIRTARITSLRSIAVKEFSAQHPVEQQYPRSAQMERCSVASPAGHDRE